MRPDFAHSHYSWPNLAILVLLSFLVTACSVAPYTPPQPQATPPAPRPGTQAPQPAPTQTPPAATTTKPKAQTPTEPTRTIARGVRTERSRPSAAALAMIDKARAARQSGDLPQATSMLERAQRMSPQAAEVYFELAAVKMAEGAYVQAEQLCQKALSLAGDDSRFRAEVWGRIADIREARGDHAGAADARQNAKRQG